MNTEVNRNNLALSEDQGIDVFAKPVKTAEEKIIEANDKNVSSVDIPEIGENIDVFGKPPVEVIEEKTTEEVVDDVQPPVEASDDVKEEIVKSNSPRVDEVATQASEEAEDEESVVDNVFYHLGSELLSKNELPETFEIKEDVTGREIYNAYRDKIKEDAELEIQKKVIGELSGIYNETTLEYANLIASGTDPNMLYQANILKSYADIDIKDAERDDKVKVIKEYYKDRGFKDKEISKFIEDIDLQEEDPDDIAKDAKAYFKQKYDAVIDNEKTIAEQRKNNQIELRTKQREAIESVIDSGTAGGVNIPDKKFLRKSIFEADQIVTIEGNNYQASNLDIFNMQMQNDAEVYLSAFIQWLHKDELNSVIKDQGKAEAEDEFLGNYRKSVEKSKSKIVKDQIATKLKSQPQGKNKALILDSRGGLVNR